MENNQPNSKSIPSHSHEMLISLRRPDVVLTLPCTMHERHAFCNPRPRFRFKITADTPVNIWHTTG